MSIDPDRDELQPAVQTEPAQQLRTYHGFLIALRYVVLAHLVLGTVLILGFCTSTPWLAVLVVGAIELAIGLFFARDRATLEWPSQVATSVMTTAAESGQHRARRDRRGGYDIHGMHPAE